MKTIPTKYRVETAVEMWNGERVNGHDYGLKDMAMKVYERIRALYKRLGYTLAYAEDECGGIEECWEKEGYNDRYLRIYPTL